MSKHYIPLKEYTGMDYLKRAATALMLSIEAINIYTKNFIEKKPEETKNDIAYYRYIIKCCESTIELFEEDSISEIESLGQLICVIKTTADALDNIDWASDNYKPSNHAAYDISKHIKTISKWLLSDGQGWYAPVETHTTEETSQHEPEDTPKHYVHNVFKTPKVIASSEGELPEISVNYPEMETHERTLFSDHKVEIHLKHDHLSIDTILKIQNWRIVDDNGDLYLLIVHPNNKYIFSLYSEFTRQVTVMLHYDSPSIWVEDIPIPGAGKLNLEMRQGNPICIPQYDKDFAKFTIKKMRLLEKETNESK